MIKREIFDLSCALKALEWFETLSVEDHAYFAVNSICLLQEFRFYFTTFDYKTTLIAFVLYLLGSEIRFVRCSFYVTKQFFGLHFVVLFNSLLTENICFGHQAVISLPHDTCAGRQMIKFITLKNTSFVLGKPMRLLFLYLLCC